MVSIVVPTREEADNIVPLCEELIEVVDDLGEIIVVDDESSDGTAERALSHFAAEPRVRVIRRVHDHGLARAVHCGIAAAKSDVVVVMDADFNHEPRCVPELLARLGDADIAVGSRFVAGGGMDDPFRQACSRAFSRAAGALLATGTAENLSGFFAARTALLRALPGDAIFHGYGDYFFRLLFHAARRGARIVEIPVWYSRRRSGESKTRFVSVALRYGVEVVRLRLAAGHLRPGAHGGLRRPRWPKM